MGERRQDAELPADEHERPDAVRADARDAVQRQDAGFGAVTRFSVWNEPNLQLFLAPQFDGHEDRQPGGLREALHGRLQGDQGRATRARSSRPARPRTAATTTRAGVRATRSRRRPSRGCSPRPTRSSRSTPGRPPVPEHYAARPPTQRVAYPNVALLDDDPVRRRPAEVVPPPGPDLGHRVRRADEPAVHAATASATRSRRPT